MSQSRKMSLIEQLVSVAIGFAVSLFIQLTLLPAMGIKTTYGQDFIIVAVFTAASIIRGYIVRRGFNWLHKHQSEKELRALVKGTSTFTTIRAAAPRLETAINKMLMVIDKQEQIKQLESEIESLIFLSEAKDPAQVRGIDMARVAGTVKKCEHVGHAVKYGEAEVHLHSRGDRSPGDRIFQSVYRAWKGKV